MNNINSYIEDLNKWFFLESYCLRHFILTQTEQNQNPPCVIPNKCKSINIYRSGSFKYQSIWNKLQAVKTLRSNISITSIISYENFPSRIGYQINDKQIPIKCYKRYMIEFFHLLYFRIVIFLWLSIKQETKQEITRNETLTQEMTIKNKK